jgi:hypothetical protein
VRNRSHGECLKCGLFRDWSSSHWRGYSPTLASPIHWLACRTCDAMMYGAALNTLCATLEGPATVRIGTGRERMGPGKLAAKPTALANV